MRKYFVIGFAILSRILWAQTDSTTLHFKSIENEDLRIVCELTDIQVIKVKCYDTTLKNKVFNIVIREFNEGKVINTNDLNVTSEQKEIPIIMGKDTMVYIINMIEKAGFTENADSVSITFAGQLKNGIFKLRIKYPGLGFQQELKGGPEYQLREIYSCSDNSIKVPINHSIPILAYTPPFDTGTEISSYCLLGEEKMDDWYTKYKVAHFYAFYLEIK